jgi:ElaB/YqjD/DUF883 family membrane-anchored ribosome-binding protein
MSASNETPGSTSKTSNTRDEGKVHQDLADLGQDVKDQVAAMGEEATAQVGHMAEKAKSMASEQKDLIAEQLGGLTDALDKVAADLESSDEAAAPYLRMVADRAESLTAAIRDNDVDTMVSMTEDFGRRQPVAFLGIAAILGFAASRFLRASAARRAEDQMQPVPSNGYSAPNGAEDGMTQRAGGLGNGGDNAGI